MITRLFYSCLIIVISTASQAGELSRTRAEMRALNAQIEDLQQSLNKNIENEKSVTSALDQIEFAQSGLRRKIEKKQTEKVALEASLKRLAAESSVLNRQSADAKQRLGGLLKSGYLLGKQSALRMFISQQDPHTAARRLTMFSYVLEARNRQLEKFAALQSALQENRNLTEVRQSEMEEAIDALNATKADLATKEAQRIIERDKLRATLASSSAELAGYQERQKSLEKLITQLSKPRAVVKKPVVRQPVAKKPATEQPQRQAPSDTAEQQAVVDLQGEAGQAEVATDEQQLEDQPARESPEQKPLTLAGFGKAKGGLPRPLSAAVKVRFGDKKEESGLRWDGVLFGASDKQPVQVIYPGQVVFSDWFRGYGQLMVVDHGEGYMSLYGHNQQLQVAVGDQVQAGQTIAMASDASERPLPGLYFEIRHNGAPADPLKWVK